MVDTSIISILIYGKLDLFVLVLRALIYFGTLVRWILLPSRKHVLKAVILYGTYSSARKYLVECLAESRARKVTLFWPYSPGCGLAVLYTFDAIHKQIDFLNTFYVSARQVPGSS